MYLNPMHCRCYGLGVSFPNAHSVAKQMSSTVAAINEYEANISKFLEIAEHISQDYERYGEITSLYLSRVSYLQSQLVRLSGSEPEYPLLVENLSLLKDSVAVFSRRVEEARLISMGTLGTQLDDLRTEVETLLTVLPHSLAVATPKFTKCQAALDNLCTKLMAGSTTNTLLIKAAPTSK